MIHAAFCLLSLFGVCSEVSGSRGAATARSLTFYVAPDGSDRWSGRLPRPNRAGTDGPLATLEHAREHVRSAKLQGKAASDIVVEVAAGRYRTDALHLTAEDSGTAEHPIIYRSHPGAEVRLTGGQVVDGFQPVTDPAILARLDPAARGHVLQAKLADGGAAQRRIQAGAGVGQSEPGTELFFQDRPMNLARWPNKGFVKIADVLNLDPVDVRGTKGDKVGKFVYGGDRPQRWVGEKDAWLHGYWFWDWSDQRQKIEAIDTSKRIITLAKPYHGYGYRKGQWYYAFNILAELDEPGEWYLDQVSRTLYFWPPAPIQPGQAVISDAQGLITLEGVSNVTFSGFTLEAARGTAITGRGCRSVRVEGCTIRNVGQWGVRLDDADNCKVAGCDIYQVGAGGISLSAGDRKTLHPGGAVTENNHIHHYSRWNPMYNPAVQISGVGCRVSHNLIHDAPHMAIGFSGNDHLIEYNEIHHVCEESNDAGAMYAGRDWSMRGTMIRYNYLHDISGFEGRGCVGVYLDDQWSGTTIFGNLFVNVTRAAMIGGGRDCTIENNVFVDCAPATHVDARGLGWAADGFDDLKRKLEAVPYNSPPWSERYPQLVNILNVEPMAPKGNLIARNICVGGRWGDFEGRAKPMVRFEDNALDQDPQFVDRAKRDFRLKPGSPAFKVGFKPLPLREMGMRR